MKNSLAVSLALGLAAIVLVALGLFIVRPVLAQVVASSTELILGTTTPSESVEAVSASTTEISPAGSAISPEPAILGASTSTDESSASTSADPISAATGETSSTVEISSPLVEPPAAEAASASGLVEVQLECSMSYTGSLYDTPSGHLDEGYFIGEAAASTTGMTAAHEIGTQAWTVCYDDERNTYEFKITQEEYDSHKIRGTPKKSVMKPAPAASATAPPATATESATTTAPSPIPNTPTPEVLGASTSTTETSSPPAMPTPTESASTSTPQSDAQPPTAQSTSTPLE